MSNKQTKSVINSPLRYPGGKSKAIKFIKGFIPDFCELREPMIGGGSFILHFLQLFENKIFVASDLNYDVFCFWEILKTESSKLIDSVQFIYDKTNDGRKLYEKILTRRNKQQSEFDRAVDFFILNRITFSGVVDAGGYSKASYDGRFTQSSINRLKKTSEIIKKIYFIYSDYSLLLKKPGKDIFLFLDPPYYSVSRSRLYGKKGLLHTEFNHEKFFVDVKECSHKWLITYDNSEYIRNLYKEYSQVEWELQYGMNNYKRKSAAKGKELLIANFDLRAQLSKNNN